MCAAQCIVFRRGWRRRRKCFRGKKIQNTETNGKGGVEYSLRARAT